MLYEYLPNWAVTVITIGIVVFSVVAEYLIQKKDKANGCNR